MLDRFKEFIQNNQLIEKEDKILLTLSGGIDSMVMVYLYMETDFDFGIAHCNFHLRGEESNGDAAFVRAFVEKHKLEYHEMSFDTKGYAEKQGVSTQIAARELRYQWFDELAKEHQYTKIATAHHLDDSIETFFINLTRGTGINGLNGIPLVQKNIIRPLLFCYRKDIVRFAGRQHIEYREDSSNASTKYTRNKIRHNILPLFDDIKDGFSERMIQNIAQINQHNALYFELLNNHCQNKMQEKDDQIKIQKSIFNSIQNKETLLLELIKEKGFNASQCHQIMANIAYSGKIFYSKEFRLVIDRNEIIIEKLKEEQQETYIINQFTEEIKAPLSLNFEVSDFNSNTQISKENQIATLDADKLQFPIEIRRWQQGDSFKPYGMKGKKLLSDVFSNAKLSIPQKENIWLLCSQEKIAWIIGMRTSQDFAINNSTKKIIRITNHTK